MNQNGKPTLLQQVRNQLRLKHMSKRTEDAYIRWITDFLKYFRDLRNGWIHPQQLGSADVNRYLTYLAVNRSVAASTQNQAHARAVPYFVA